jgi:hypothetical protein
MIPSAIDTEVIQANARVVGIEIEASRLPMIEAGLAAVGATIAQSPLALAFETEPAGFNAMLECHAAGAPEKRGA